MFPENKTGKCFFHFPPSRNSTQKQYLQRDCVTFLRSKNCLSFFFPRRHFQKVLYSSVILFACFFDSKYHLHLPLFSLTVMAFPACTCVLVHIQHSSEFLCVVSGLGVQVWFKRYLHAAARVPMFSPFLHLYFYFLPCIITHVCLFLFLLRLPSDFEVGYEMSILTKSLFVSKNPCYL